MTRYELYFHLVWTTKDRTPTIQPEWEDELYSVIEAQAKALDGWVYAIGGVQDHLHLLVSLTPYIAVATFINQVRDSSADFINTTFKPVDTFAWQSDYACITLERFQIDGLAQYIRNQKQYHSDGKMG